MMGIELLVTGNTPVTIGTIISIKCNHLLHKPIVHSLIYISKAVSAKAFINYYTIKHVDASAYIVHCHALELHC